jgi:hypothetical protein
MCLDLVSVERCRDLRKPLNSFIIPSPTTIELAGMMFTIGAFQISFTNTPGASFTVLTTTNPSLPLNDWTTLGSATETSPGHYQFSDPEATNNAQHFYLVRWP